MKKNRWSFFAAGAAAALGVSLLGQSAWCWSLFGGDSSSSNYVQANITYDLSNVTDGDSQKQILAALQLGYQAAQASGATAIQKEIQDLQGDGSPRVIQFYSNQQAADGNPNAANIMVTAFSTWQGPQGPNDMVSPPSERTNIRIYLEPKQPYYGYLVNSVWHELLHTTLNITHHQTTNEGTVSAQYVNDAVWFGTIYSIMLNFPQNAVNPVTNQSEQLYDTNNSPWS